MPTLGKLKAVAAMTTFNERPENLTQILLVEDEPGIRLVFSMILEEEGYKVTEASDGREALRCLEELQPDLVITDYMMPYLTGVQLIEAIRGLPKLPNIPILLMSAALPGRIDPESLNVAFLHKPAEIGQLLAVVRELLARDGTCN